MNAQHARQALAFGVARAAAARLLTAYPQLEGGDVDQARAGVDYDPGAGDAASIIGLEYMGASLQICIDYDAESGSWSGLVCDGDGYSTQVDCVMSEPATEWVDDLVQAATELLAR